MQYNIMTCRYETAEQMESFAIGRPCHAAAALLSYTRLFRNDDEEDLTREYYFRQRFLIITTHVFTNNSE